MKNGCEWLKSFERSEVCASDKDIIGKFKDFLFLKELR